MTTNALILIGIAIIVVGFIIFVTSLKKSSKGGLGVDEVEHKDGVPILPRDKRQVVHESSGLDGRNEGEPDALSNLATVAATRTKLEMESAPVAEVNLQQVSVTQTESTYDTQATPALAMSVVPQTATEAAAVSPAQVTSEGKTEDGVAVQESFEQMLETHEEEAPVLDGYFHEKAEENLRNNDALLGQKQTVTIVISPKNSFESIEGATIMQLVRQYALKYGVLNMFHRYENPEGTGMLWFSMLGVGVDGVEAFDLVTLPEMNYRGLALFLSLPHPQAVRGFDSMVQVARSIADELYADIHDEAGYLLDHDQLQALRAMVSEYQA
ncbi:MAG: cell division protein ZipA C-terminal FtsZ-binding domain-containing protein [Moraxella sp.]|nr:cell division protein ZipA C-terminal FtsZ-binding domain-containing protein [Moraxella sp.]